MYHLQRIHPRTSRTAESCCFTRLGIEIGLGLGLELEIGLALGLCINYREYALEPVGQLRTAVSQG
jgi:hypothetical protein